MLCRTAGENLRKSCKLPPTHRSAFNPAILASLIGDILYRPVRSDQQDYFRKNVFPLALYLLRRLFTYSPSSKNSPTLASVAGSPPSSCISLARARAAGVRPFTAFMLAT